MVASPGVNSGMDRSAACLPQPLRRTPDPRREAHLVEACRYIVLNPVRAGLVSRPGAGAGAVIARARGVDLAPRFLAESVLLSLYRRQRRPTKSSSRKAIAGVRHSHRTSADRLHRRRRAARSPGSRPVTRASSSIDVRPAATLAIPSSHSVRIPPPSPRARSRRGSPSGSRARRVSRSSASAGRSRSGRDSRLVAPRAAALPVEHHPVRGRRDVRRYARLDQLLDRRRVHLAAVRAELPGEPLGEHR